MHTTMYFNVKGLLNCAVDVDSYINIIDKCENHEEIREDI